jgi:hypothetical protein
MIGCKCKDSDHPELSNWTLEQVQEIAKLLQCPVDEIWSIEIVDDEVIVERLFHPVGTLKVHQLASFKHDRLLSKNS